MELFKRYYNTTNQTVYTLSTGEKVYPTVVDIKKGMQGGGDISYVETDNNVGFIIVSLVEGESKFKIPSTATVTCNIKRPDGHFLEIGCTKMDESTVQIALGSAGTKVEGVHSFDIKIQYSDDIVIGTPIMSYMVQSGLTLDGAIEEDERLPMLTALIEEVKIIHENTTELAEEVSELSENIGAIVEGAGARLDEEIAEFRMQSEELIDSANSAVEEVNNSLEQITTSLEEVNQGIDEVNDAISNVNNALEEVDNNMDRIDSVIIEASQAIESMEYIQNTSIELNEQSEMLISEMQGLIADGLDIEELINARDGEESLSVRLNRDLQGVYEYVDNKQIDLSPVESKIAENANKITANTDKLTAYKELIDDNTANVVNHDTRITANTNAINQNVADILSTRQEITTEVNNLKTEVVEDIANTNDNVARLQEELQKSENTKYSTTNGVKEFTCKDGYVDNVVIEGETLVNLVDFDVSRANSDGIIIRTYFKSADRVSNGTYTLFNNNDKEMYFVTSKISNGEYVGGYTIFPNTPYLLELDSDTQCYGIDFGITQFGWVNDTTWYTSDNVKAIILEGDHTDKPISYFEGLKSVGQGDKIEVVTYQENQEVELKFSCFKTNANLNDGVFAPTDDTTNAGSPFLYVDGGKVRLSRNGHILLYDKNFRFIRSIVSAGTNIFDINDASYIRLWYADYDVEFIAYHTPYLDKKQISTTLRSLPNGVKDTIEKRGNKYVKVQRCGEVTLSGNESWNSWGLPSQDICKFYITVSGTKPSLLYTDAPNIYCSRFKPRPQSDMHEGTSNVEGVAIGHSHFQEVIVCIDKNKLSTQDIEGFKTWLSSNPVTIVYELEIPQIIELPNFNPQTYEGDTTLLLNTGVIQGECEFEVTNSKGSELEVLKDKVSSLGDNYSYDYTITSLNGWQFANTTITRAGNHIQINMILTVQGVHIPSTKIAVLPPSLKPRTVVICNLMDISGSPIGTIEIVNNYIQVNGSFTLADTHHGCFASFSYYI